MKLVTKANLLFLLVSALWGATFPIIKSAVGEVSPAVFVCVRFSLAALLFLPFVFHELRDTKKILIKAGVILGLLNIPIYLFQTMSLVYISASRCAFITGSFVVMIPFLAHIFKVSPLKWADVVAATLCLIGLYILTGANLQGLNYGDFLVSLCAFAYALSVVYLQYLSQKYCSPKLLAFYQIVFTVPLPLALCLIERPALPLSNFIVWGGIAYCAIFATIFPMFIQARYQRDTTPTQAALIFSLEPIFAALFAWMFYAEVITKHILWGGILILMSSVLPILFKCIAKTE